MCYEKKGFIYGVGKLKTFMKSAKLSAMSVKDYYPDANITICAPPSLVDPQCSEIFDNIISNDSVPNNARTKLWALSHTPYDLTMYLDADTICMSEEIQQCFDQIKNYDIVFTNIRLYNSNRKGIVDSPNFQYHGGVFLYNRKSIPFMIEWWERWNEGQTTWKYDNYPSHLRIWDQFYLFYILNHTNHGLNVGVFEEDARWNFVNGYFRTELGGKPEIIRHNTIKAGLFHYDKC